MNIGELKKHSDLSYDVAIAKRNALEKANSRQIIVYNEHIFRADPQTINLVKNLSELHSSPFYILDTNNNPVEIQNPKEFLSKNIFKVLKKQKPGKNGEIHITDAIKKLIHQKNKFIGHIFSGKYLDCGTMKGYVNSTLEVSKL